MSGPFWNKLIIAQNLLRTKKLNQYICDLQSHGGQNSDLYRVAHGATEVEKERCKTTESILHVEKNCMYWATILDDGGFLKFSISTVGWCQLQNLSIISNAALSSQPQNLCCHPLHHLMNRCWTPCPYLQACYLL